MHPRVKFKFHELSYKWMAALDFSQVMFTGKAI